MTPAQQVAHTARGQLLMEEIEEHPCLVLAAVEGWCLGGGFELALACDVRIAGAEATFGLPEVTLGMIPGWGGTYRLARVAGLGLAKAIALAGLRLDAPAAERAGIAMRVVPEGGAYEAAIEIAAAATAKTDRDKLARAKTLLTLGAHVDNRTGRQLELLTESLLTGGDDYGKR
jgi:enoyl-CoA hydratase